MTAAGDTEPPDAEPADTEPTEAAGGRSTVARIIGVLEAVATTDDGVGVRSLARETGIDRSAVSRLLLQLAELGIAAPTENGRYAIGPRLFAIAGAVTSRDELRRAARPSLEALAERFNETSYLAVLEDGQVVYRDVIESTQPLRYVGELGVASPLHAGAAGRAILAGLDDEAFERWIAAADLSAVTAATITDAGTLRERRAGDRASGYAVSRGERVAGGAAVAAPFVDGSARVRGSLVVTCPRDRLPSGRERTIGGALVAMTRRLSWRLGSTDAAHRSAAAATAAPAAQER
jgi:IclR family acetate operon transcriptional repressor